MNTFEKIEQWAHDRNLIEGATPAAQTEKFFEETGELARALIEDNEDNFVDAVGDCVVVLTILCKQKGLDIQNCIDAAYAEIKNRKGKMVNGIFIKEE